MGRVLLGRREALGGTLSFDLGKTLGGRGPCTSGLGKGLEPGSVCHSARTSLYGRGWQGGGPRQPLSPRPKFLVWVDHSQRSTGDWEPSDVRLRLANRMFFNAAFGLSAKGNYQKVGVRNNIIRRMCFPVHGWHPAAFCGVCNTVNDEKQT